MLAAAAGCFAAGAGVGLLIPRFAEAEELPRSVREREQDEKLVLDLVADLGLSDSQARSLRLIMQNQREEQDRVIAELLSTEAEDLPVATRNRLRTLSYQTTKRILVVLDPQQRARYERESRPGPSVVPEQGAPSAATNR